MLTFTKAVGAFLLPPGIVIVLGLLGLLVLPRWRLLAGVLVGSGTLALYVLSLPATGMALLHRLESGFPALPTPDATLRARAEAIVVLGGGREMEAPEYRGDTVSAATLERLRYAARLHRATGLPVLVSGGSPFGELVAEAELMQRVLLEDFRVPTTWVERRARTTLENAAYARALLQAAGIRRVFVVTHAWHMARAAWAFERTGLEIQPAPVGFGRSKASGTVLDWLPSARGLSLTSRALREHLALAWYRWRDRMGRIAPPAGLAAPAGTAPR
ncbi:MAG TPA: YdcF family protein [Burkholderiales bacterium]